MNKKKGQSVKNKDSSKRNNIGTFNKETDDVIKMTNKKRDVIQKNNKNKNMHKNLKNNSKKKIINKQNKIKIKKIISVILKLMLIILIIIGIFAFIFISPIFNIKNIEISNNEKINKETILSLSNLKTDENIFSFNKTDIINSIKENAYIQDVKILRSVPNTVKIQIIERKPKYCIEIVGKYAYIDNQGYILEISDLPNDLICIKGVQTEESEILPRNRLIEADLKKLQNILEINSSADQNELTSKISSIDIQDDKNYILNLTEEGKVVHFGDCTNINEKIVYIIAIVETEKGKLGNIYVNDNYNEEFKPRFKENV